MRQFKEETRRLSSAKSRVDDAEMAQKMPKLQIKEFLRHALGNCPKMPNFRTFRHMYTVDFKPYFDIIIFKERMANYHNYSIIKQNQRQAPEIP